MTSWHVSCINVGMNLLSSGKSEKAKGGAYDHLSDRAGAMRNLLEHGLNVEELTAKKKEGRKMKKGLIIMMVLGLVFSAGSAMAVDSKSNTNDYDVDLEQFINIDNSTVENGAITGAFVGSQVSESTWTVGSNNAVNIQFASTTKGTDGANVTDAPQYYKQSKKADGTAITNDYDVLVTEYAVNITGAESTELSKVLWGTSVSDPAGSPADLVKAHTVAASPGGTIGRIMPADATGQFVVHLYSQGHSTQDDQSGTYDLDVQITVSPEEQDVASDD